MPAKRVIVLDLVCLTADQLEQQDKTPTLSRLAREGWQAPLIPPFPAVSSTVQASLFTGLWPREHGVVSNGLYERDRYNVRFWDQPTTTVTQEKVWERLKRYDPEATTALLFFPNTTFATAEVVVTPAPVRESDALIPWCYSKPVGYYEQLADRHGAFELPWIWGPLAGRQASEWIARAAGDSIRDHRPTVTWVYLPHLDFSAQRHGTASSEYNADLAAMDELVGSLLDNLHDQALLEDTAVLLVSEYAFEPVSRPVYLNRALRDAGLLSIREIGGREYLDYELSRAFAMVDHQVAHLYVKSGVETEVHNTLRALPGVENVLHDFEKGELQINHPNSGEMIALAESGAWFPYYWWLDDEKAPPFARKVATQRKPGNDPVQLFLDAEGRSIPLDATLIKASHGRPVREEAPRPLLVAWGAGLPRKPPQEVSARLIPDLILGLLGHRGPPRPTTPPGAGEPTTEMLEDQLRIGG